MKKNLVIVVLVIAVAIMGVMLLNAQKTNKNLERELGLTGQALFSVGRELEEMQYLNRWTGDPTEYDHGLFKYSDFYGYHGSCEYKMRILNWGDDFPMVFNSCKRTAKLADNYDGYDFDNVLIEFK